VNIDGLFDIAENIEGTSYLVQEANIQLVKVFLREVLLLMKFLSLPSHC